MSNIEKIRQEIERLMKETEDSQFDKGERYGLKTVLAFIDSLQEEKPSEDLEEAAEKFSFISEGVDSSGEPYKDYDSGKLEGFIAGAEWMSKQINNE